MAILHGSWLMPPSIDAQASTTSALGGTHPHTLFLWGETWRRTDPAASNDWQVASHPLALAPDELAKALQQWQQAGLLRLPDEMQALLKAAAKKRRSRQSVPPTDASVDGWGTAILALPAAADQEPITPYHSASPPDAETPLCLQPVRVLGLSLSLPMAVAFLRTLPLSLQQTEDNPLGSDLLFWSHVSRWSLDLLARTKFLPTVIAPKPDEDAAMYVPRWQPLLDSAVDQARYRQFTAQMPNICQCYQVPLLPLDATELPSLGVQLPPTRSEVLSAVLNALVDQQVRVHCQANDPPSVNPLFKQWLQALVAPEPQLPSDSDATVRLVSTLQNWAAPVREQQLAFRTCFHLQPPSGGQTQWLVDYWLQATDDPDVLISAETIWKTPTAQLHHLGYTIERPQETLLKGLGLASRVYPLIEESLQTACPARHALTPTQAYEFLKAAVWRLEDSGFGVMLPPSLANREGLANRLGLQIQAQGPDPQKMGSIGLESLLNFKWELAIGGQTISKADFDDLVAKQSPLVEINGEWVELRSQDIRAAQKFFAARQDQTGLSLQDALRISAGDTLMLDKLPVVNFEASGPLQALLNTLGGNQSLETIDDPPGFQGTLRPYQARGVSWLSFLEQWGLGACLADDMGLGKTIQFIAFVLLLQARDRLSGPILLICPTSVLGNWEREIKRFAPNIKAIVHHGSDRDRGKTFARKLKTKDLVITSYPLIYRDESTLGAVKWWGLVLDEAQNIKNPDARQSKAVRQLQAHCRIALTGTPLENRLTELWSILDFLNPGYLGPRAFFQRRFATPIERYGDTASLQTLRSLVQPFILRRTKTDRDIIQDLPDKQEMTVFCSLTPEQAALYEQTVQSSLEAVEAAQGIQRRGLILATLVKLKQICNHPAQFLKEDHLEGDRSGKLHRLEAMLEELLEEGDRALIFTQFAELGKLLQRYLERHLQREILLLYGSTSKKKREEMIDRFQHDPQGPRLFILSLKAGGVGLNLTRANHVFHFDRWWNPAVENQATDRVFRIGQTRNVQVHKFVCNGTLEERIHEQLESKKALAEQVVGAGENWLTDLDTDQLRNLLLLDRSAVIDEDG